MTIILTIQSDDNYYNTQHHVSESKIRYFTDRNLFSVKSSFRNNSVNSKAYEVAFTTTDSSGQPRKILSPSNDIFSSSIIDAYRQGVEITQNKHWTAGFAKITAGTPGHLYDKNFFGIYNSDLVKEYLKSESLDAYYDSEIFNPVSYILNTGSSSAIDLSHSQAELELNFLNGTIEPFTIRDIVTMKSLYFPYEAHSIKGQYGEGNINWKIATDEILSVDYYDTSKKNFFFLDGGQLSFDTLSTPKRLGSFGVIGGHLNLAENAVMPFQDLIYQRDHIPSASYGSIMMEALLAMTGSRYKENYVPQKKKSATNGFDCEYIDQGVDSINYRNLTWNPRNRINNGSINRRHRKSIVNLRDSESYISTNTTFNDNNVVLFLSSSNQETVEYPAMISLQLTSSLGLNSTIQSELFKSGSIRVTRGMKSGLYETPLSDSILSSKRRLGTL